MRLVPGDCLIFDNTRVLHARTAFAAPAAPGDGAPAGVSSADSPAAGDAPAENARAEGTAADDVPGEDMPGAAPARERHLQGCYADIDGLLSTLAVLRRAAPVAHE